MDWFGFFPGYTTAIYETGREPAFLMLLSFLLTYLITRGYTRIARKTGWGSASFGGVHTHHMVFGMVIAFAAGATMFSMQPVEGFFLNFLAVAFGAGVALVLDEFALFFHLEDVYWEREGRKSVDAVVLAAGFGSLLLLQTSPLGLDSGNTGMALVLLVVFDMAFALVAALKGKIILALFGVFIPTLAQIAAIRLAEPNSMWARRFYRDKPDRMARSVARYTAYERRWRHRKEKLWDIIGGKTGRPTLPKTSR